MAWIALVFAGILEVVWATGLVYTRGFTKLWPSVGTLIALMGSMLLLAVATRTLPIGTAYPIWVGIGALGAAIVGVVLFGEPMMHFVEPMITREFLLHRENFSLPVPKPAVLGRATRYPTEFVAHYDKDQDVYQFVFKGFHPIE